MGFNSGFKGLSCVSVGVSPIVISVLLFN